MSNNGETNVDTEDLDIEEKLDVLVEAVRELSEKLDEVIEKLANLSTDADGFRVFDES